MAQAGKASKFTFIYHYSLMTISMAGGDKLKRSKCFPECKKVRKKGKTACEKSEKEYFTERDNSILYVGCS